MIDREKVIKGINEMLLMASWDDINSKRHKFQQVLNEVLDLLKSQPGVVQCKDCAMAISINNVLFCGNEVIKTAYVPNDWYCGDGRKKL